MIKGRYLSVIVLSQALLDCYFFFWNLLLLVSAEVITSHP
jgi:hypothetical protein